MNIWFDRQGNPLDSATANTLLLDEDYKRIGLTCIRSTTDPGADYLVSTVWLGVNTNFLGGPPILFETMVFRAGEYPHGPWRWGTEEQAAAGHEEIVLSVAATVTDAVVQPRKNWPHQPTAPRRTGRTYRRIVRTPAPPRHRPAPAAPSALTTAYTRRYHNRQGRR